MEGNWYALLCLLAALFAYRVLNIRIKYGIYEKVFIVKLKLPFGLQQK